MGKAETREESMRKGSAQEDSTIWEPRDFVNRTQNHNLEKVKKTSM